MGRLLHVHDEFCERGGRKLRTHRDDGTRELVLGRDIGEYESHSFDAGERDLVAEIEVVAWAGADHHPLQVRELV